MADTMTIVGNNIKLLRKQSKLSQGNLAAFLGVDQSFISKIENGERAIAAEMLEKITDLFGITLADIIAESKGFKSISFALRADQISEKDLETISRINKIALNLRFMDSLIEEENEIG